MKRHIAGLVTAIAVAALAACSGGEPGPGSENATSASAPPPGASLTAPTFTPIETMATDAGPRPLLEWAAVDGADEYQVTVFTASGNAYWSWSGSETSVYVGGIHDPDAVGPHVFEAMTWVVMAATVDGDVLAMSQPAALTP